MYAPLLNKSHYSFLEGASAPGELIETAHHLGLRHLALTDRDGLHGIVRGHVKARELGVHLIIGSQVTVADQPLPRQIAASEPLPTHSSVVLLYTSRRGYRNLCRLIKGTSTL